MVETRRDYCVNIFPSGNNFSCSFYNVPFTLNPHSPMSSAFSHPFSNLLFSACQSFLPLHPRWLLLLPFSAIISPAQPRFLAQIRACRYGRVDIIFEEAFSTKLQPICARVCSLTRHVAVPAGTVAWGSGNASWWSVPELLPPLGPFYYAFRNDQSPQVGAAHAREPDLSLTSHAVQLYLGFSFPGVQGWVQQNFFNVTLGRPPRDVFELPTGASAARMLCCRVAATLLCHARSAHAAQHAPSPTCMTVKKLSGNVYRRSQSCCIFSSIGSGTPTPGHPHDACARTW
jgi:hypothetical protein